MRGTDNSHTVWTSIPPLPQPTKRERHPAKSRQYEQSAADAAGVVQNLARGKVLQLLKGQLLPLSDRPDYLRQDPNGGEVSAIVSPEVAPKVGRV